MANRFPNRKLRKGCFGREKLKKLREKFKLVKTEEEKAIILYRV